MVSRTAHVVRPLCADKHSGRILDTLTTVNVAQSIYTFMVINLNNVVEDTRIPW